MPTVDSLDIQISAQANKASASLTTLINRLDRVSASLSSVNSRGFATMGSGVNKLANAMNNFSNNTKTADFSRLAKNLTAINSVDTAGFSRMASGISSISTSLSNLPNMGDKADQLGTLAKGISQLGYKSADKAIHNIPLLASAMNYLMTQLSRAPKVSQNLIDMTNALAKLSRTGASSGRAATSLGRSLDVYTASTNRATKGTFSLAGALGKMYASYWLIFRSFSKIGESITLASDLTEVQNVVDVTFGDMAYKIEEFADSSLEMLGMSELTAKKTASIFQSMGNAMEIDSSAIEDANKFLNEQTNGYADLGNSMADVSLNLTKLTADMTSLYGDVLDVNYEDVADDLRAIFTGQTEPLSAYGIILTETTLKEWALSEGLNANISSMTGAEKAMLRYQYVLAHTGAAHGDFAKNINTWSNQLKILRENFKALGAVIGKTFINMLKPLVKDVNAAMSSILNFATTIYNALGKIFGWKIETPGGGITSDLEDGEDAAGGIADGVGEAADNAEKLKKQLQGFDRLNVLTSDTDTGNGTSGGAGGGGGANIGEFVDTGESMLEEFKSDIDSLYELGDYISQTLSRMMESIDWESVYQKARNFGKGLADFLNGLISPRLFGNIGKTIAGALNTALHFLHSFGETFEWDEFGKSIGWGINDFFSNFDFALLAQTINTWVQGIWTTLITAIETINWSNAFSKIGDFLKNIDIKTVAIILGAIQINKIRKAIFAKGALSILGSTISKKLGASIASKLGVEISKNSGISAALFAGLKKNFLNVFSKFGLLFEGLFNGLKLSEAIAGAFGGSASTIAAIGTTIAGAASIVSGSILAFTNFFSMLKEGFSWVKEILMVLGIAITAVGAVILGAPALVAGVVAAIVAAVATVAVVVHDNWDAIKQFFSDLWSSIKETVANIAATISEWFTNSVAPWFTKEKWSKLWQDVKKFFSDGWNDIVAWWKQSGIYKWYNETVKPWFTKAKWNFTEIKEGLSQAFNDAIAALKGIWESFKEWIKDKLSFDFEFNIPEFGNDSKGKNSTANTQTKSYKATTPSISGLYSASRVSYAGSYGSNASSSNMVSTDFERAVELAVSRTLTPYLSEIARNTKETANKEFGITERAIGRAVENQNRIKSTRTGRDLFGRKI